MAHFRVITMLPFLHRHEKLFYRHNIHELLK